MLASGFGIGAGVRFSQHEGALAPRPDPRDVHEIQLGVDAAVPRLMGSFGMRMAGMARRASNTYHIPVLDPFPNMLHVNTSGRAPVAPHAS